MLAGYNKHIQKSIKYTVFNTVIVMVYVNNYLFKENTNTCIVCKIYFLSTNNNLNISQQPTLSSWAHIHHRRSLFLVPPDKDKIFCKTSRLVLFLAWLLHYLLKNYENLLSYLTHFFQNYKIKVRLYPEEDHKGLLPPKFLQNVN